MFDARQLKWVVAEGFTPAPVDPVMAVMCTSSSIFCAAANGSSES